jgi:hypothetical protein
LAGLETGARRGKEIWTGTVIETRTTVRQDNWTGTEELKMQVKQDPGENEIKDKEREVHEQGQEQEQEQGQERGQEQKQLKTQVKQDPWESVERKKEPEQEKKQDKIRHGGQIGAL